MREPGRGTQKRPLVEPGHVGAVFSKRQRTVPTRCNPFFSVPAFYSIYGLLVFFLSF